MASRGRDGESDILPRKSRGRADRAGSMRRLQYFSTTGEDFGELVRTTAELIGTGNCFSINGL
jgi:hypothetical protein